jgi:hypothetical protein
VNPAEPGYKSFLKEVVPLALDRQMGIIGMKVYLRGLARRIPWYTSMEPFLRFALSQPVTNVVIGCDDVGQLAENVRFAASYAPMTDLEMQAIVHEVSLYARQLMYYKP